MVFQVFLNNRKFSIKRKSNLNITMFLNIPSQTHDGMNIESSPNRKKKKEKQLFKMLNCWSKCRL